MTPTKVAGAIWGFLFFLFFVLLVTSIPDAQHQRYITYKQTDPKDIVTRNKIDREIDGWIKRLDWQIQADTVTITGTSDPDTIYLDWKYQDANFQVFVTAYVYLSKAVGAVALTDSSFKIEKDHEAVGVVKVQWMSVHK